MGWGGGILLFFIYLFFTAIQEKKSASTNMNLPTGMESGNKQALPSALGKVLKLMIPTPPSFTHTRMLACTHTHLLFLIWSLVGEPSERSQF